CLRRQIPEHQSALALLTVGRADVLNLLRAGKDARRALPHLMRLVLTPVAVEHLAVPPAALCTPAPDDVEQLDLAGDAKRVKVAEVVKVAEQVERVRERRVEEYPVVGRVHCRLDPRLVIPREVERRIPEDVAAREQVHRVEVEG